MRVPSPSAADFEKVTLDDDTSNPFELDIAPDGRVFYIERDGRSLVCTEKGLNVIRLLDGHALTSPGMTGDWEHRLGRIEHGEETRARFMHDIAEFATRVIGFRDGHVVDDRVNPAPADAQALLRGLEPEEVQP